MTTPPEPPPGSQPGSQPGYGPPPGWDPGTGAPGPAGAAPWGAPPAQGWGAPPGPAWSGQPQTSTKAIVALVLAILAYTFLPFLAAVAGLVLARMARTEIRASGGRLSGEGIATAAFWISLVHLVFVALLFLGLLLFFGVFGVLGFS